MVAGHRARRCCSPSATSCSSSGRHGLPPLRPQFCSIYDPDFWRHERFWKVPSDAYLRLLRRHPVQERGLAAAGCPARPQGLRRRLRLTGADASSPSATTARSTPAARSSATRRRTAPSSPTASRIGAGCTLGVGAFVHYGVTMGDGAVLAPDSFLMKGEEIPPQRTGAGTRRARCRSPPRVRHVASATTIGRRQRPCSTASSGRQRSRWPQDRPAVLDHAPARRHRAHVGTADVGRDVPQATSTTWAATIAAPTTTAARPRPPERSTRRARSSGSSTTTHGGQDRGNASRPAGSSGSGVLVAGGSTVIPRWTLTRCRASASARWRSREPTRRCAGRPASRGRQSVLLAAHAKVLAALSGEREW